ncbi:MFS transporter [Kribbella shirazensis]|uniref:OPA family glycerol-3-phosphate transporter-like MFS transporter n=1 Tax=Kribbella shirazensis TaxID=1105143 RepID=A0A7X5VC24_9ACTN|nr:MFS transporter [Kribbella shirazensis]NIK58466.1 OPA family glycerol-3-phosphate transporter-like MFS transporter [Kribbella shirazensis]
MSSTLDPTAANIPAEPVSEASFRRLAWRMLLAAMFCYLFFYTGRQAFGFAIPGIQKDLDWTKATVGTISGIALWSYAIGQMVNGNLADKFGGRRLMALGAVLSTTLCIIASFMHSAAGMAVALGANGFVQAMGWSAGGRVISNWWSHHERGKSFGFYTLAAGSSSVLVYVTSTLTISTFDLDWEWLFRLPVLLMLVGGITFFLVARDTPRNAGITPPRSFTHDADDVAYDAGGAAPSSTDRYKTVLGIPRIWVTGVAIGFQNAARYGLLIWVPVYFLGDNWKKTDNAVWITVALPVGMAVGALVNGQLSDRIFGSRRDRPIMLFMVLGALSSLGMWALHPGVGLGIVLLFLTGFFVYGPQSSFWALCPDLAGKVMAGTAVGVVNFFAYLFAGAAEPVIGRIMDHNGGDAGLIFPIVAICCTASAAVASTIRR